MRKLALALTVAALAAPAFAQETPRDPLADRIANAVPPAEAVEAIAPALDQALGALLSVDVGPLIDAADPYRRRHDYGRPGRTLGNMGRRDDPYFEERMRDSIYRTTADMGRMMGAFAAAAPSIAASLRQFERAMEAAIDDYHRRRPVRGRRFD